MRDGGERHMEKDRCKHREREQERNEETGGQKPRKLEANAMRP